MYRKTQPWFICWLCLGLLLALIQFPPQVVASSPTTPASTELRGVWLTNVASPLLYLPWGVNRALNQLSQLNFNTVYPVVWNRGHTFYPSAVAKGVTGHSEAPLLFVSRFGQNILSEIVKQGNQQNLRIIPWFEYGFMAPAGSELVRRHPDWLTNRRDKTKTLKEVPKEQDLPNPAKAKVPPLTEKLPPLVRDRIVSNQSWLNPFHPEVQKFILDLIVEVVTQYDVAGIQLDDHFGLPVELGYDSFTVKLYQQEHQGKSPPTNPQDSEWMRWRANKITDFMQRIYKAVKTAKPKAIVSLSPNPQNFAYSAYLQDWPTWVKRGLVEELVLQIYRDDMSGFSSELSQPALQVARRQIPVGVGILTGLWRRPISIEQIQQQVKMVRELGFKGVSFFYWDSLWGYMAPESPRDRRAAFQELFSPPAQPTEATKKSNLQKKDLLSLPQLFR